jgi:hypothetical protein
MTISRRRALQVSAATACGLATAPLARALTAASPSEEGPAKIFVAKEGRDSNPGTESLPLASLTVALERARSSRGARKPQIVVGAGTYEVPEGLAMTAADSGAAGQPLVVEGAAGEKVVLTNSRHVPAQAFKPVTDPATLKRIDPAVRGRIVELDLRAMGLTHSKKYPDYFTDNGGLFELYCNDRRMPISRYPNDGYMQMKRALVNGGGQEQAGDWKTFYDAGAKESEKPRPGVFEYRDERTSRWAAEVGRGVWLKGYWRVPWEDPAVRIASIDTEKKTITLAAPVPGGIGNKYARPEGNGKENYILINLLEEIDSPGEWAVDFEEQKLYFYPPVALEGAEIRIADNAAPVIALRGASFVELRSLQVSCAFGDGILIEGGQQSRVLGCTVRNVGSYGLRFAGGTKHEALSNDIYATGAGGIWLGGGDDRATPRKPAAHRVVNNHIHHFGEMQKVYAPGINAGFTGGGGGGHHVAVGMYIAHNLVHDGPHAGVLHGSWDHIMEYNEIFRVCKISNDMGYFYCYDEYERSGNRTFRYNFMHNSPLADGIYFDGDNRNDLVYGNLVHIGGTGFLYKRAMTVENPLQLRCSNNIAVQCATGYRFVMRQGSEVGDNVAVECQHPFVFTKGVDGKGMPAEGDCSTGKNLAYAGDPGFVDAAASDFALRPVNSIQRDLPGFQPIPLSKAGLFVDEFRRQLPSDAALNRFANPDASHGSAYEIKDRGE